MQWLKFGGQCLTEYDKKALIECQLLNDRHINFVQRPLCNQFPSIDGLRHTLLQEQKTPQITECGIFDRENHWIVASKNIGISDSIVRFYDSVYTNVTDSSKKVIDNLFNASDIEVIDIQKQ